MPGNPRTVEPAASANAIEAPGLVHAFLPAHAKAEALRDFIEELSRTLSEALDTSVLLADFYTRGFPLWSPGRRHPERLDGRTRGALLHRGPSYDTLEAREARPSQIPGVLDRARQRYQITCADLSEAPEPSCVQILRCADSVFLVSSDDAISLELVKHKTGWLDTIGLAENTGLLLSRTTGGAGAAEVEERTGLPVCALIDSHEELCRLASWLAFRPRQAPALAS